MQQHYKDSAHAGLMHLSTGGPTRPLCQLRWRSRGPWQPPSPCNGILTRSCPRECRQHDHGRFLQTQQTSLTLATMRRTGPNNIGEHLSSASLRIIARDPWHKHCNSLSGEEKERKSMFTEATFSSVMLNQAFLVIRSSCFEVLHLYNVCTIEHNPNDCSELNSVVI